MSKEQRFSSIEAALLPVTGQLASLQETTNNLTKLVEDRFKILDDLDLAALKADHATLKDAFNRREDANPYEESENSTRLAEIDAYLDILRNDIDALRKGEVIASRSDAASSVQFSDPQHRQVYHEVKTGSPTAISLFLGREDEVVGLLQQFDSLTIPSSHAGTIAKAEDCQSSPFLSGNTTSTVLTRADPARWFY